MIAEQVIGHYTRLLAEGRIAWSEVQQSIGQIVDDYIGEVGDEHDGIVRLRTFAGGEGID
jgi:hypothetical protein